MKRLVLLISGVLLYLVTIARADTTIYLPVIINEGACMATVAKLEISDGTTTVNLLTGTDQTGFSLREWNPAVIQPKQGGVFQDSPIAPGRRLVFAVDATAIEDFTVDINDYDQDGLIEQAQDLMRLLLKARAYQSTEFQSSPVWIRARSNCETNDRYALIINWAIPQLSNPYAQPFVSATEIATMDEVSIQLERGHWLALPPGQSECVEGSATQEWDYGLSLALVSSTPTDIVTSFTRHAGSGALYAGANEQRIMKSVDNGATWANNLVVAPVPNGVIALYTLANDNILSGGSGTVTGTRALIRTTNDGGVWADVSEANMAAIAVFYQLSGGEVLAGGTDGSTRAAIWRSIDNGATWTRVFVGGNANLVTIGFAVLSDGSVLAATQEGKLLRSTDSGATWTSYATANLLRLSKMFGASDGNLYASGYNQNTGTSIVAKSTDDGLTWNIIYLSPSAQTIVNFLESSVNGVFYAITTDGVVATTHLYKSVDYGSSWQDLGYVREDANPGAIIVFYGLYQAPDTRLYAGTGVTPGNGYIYRSGVPTSTTLGRSATCTREVMVANNYHLSNVTHVKIDDGGAFTDIFPAVLPVTLFPAVPANNDALYIGTNSATLNSGPFNNIVFDIGTVMNGIYTITPEYWTGAAWATLTPIVDNTSNFTVSGVKTVHWTPPSNWAVTAVNGVTGWWVRFRISGITGAVTPPTQQNRDIYIANTNYVGLAQVGGDIPAIARIKLANLSDADGPGGNAPDLYANRVVCGLRSLDRGSGFVPIINVADEQNPVGVVVSVGTNTTFGSDITTPTGRLATYNPAGVEAMATRVTISIDASVAADFYGLFHAFLRATRTAGASTDFSVRLRVTTGSGGITFTTREQQLQVTGAGGFEVLDFGEIQLPVSSSFNATNLADVTSVAIQASAASGVPDLRIYDLILIPVDEWSCDVVDFANESDSDLGKSNGILKLLDVDSLTDLRGDIKGFVRTANNSEFITSEWNAITNGEVILQANANQRLWFFMMATSATGLSYSWLGRPNIVGSVQVFANQRYLGQRGSR